MTRPNNTTAKAARIQAKLNVDRSNSPESDKLMSSFVTFNANERSDLQRLHRFLFAKFLSPHCGHFLEDSVAGLVLAAFCNTITYLPKACAASRLCGISQANFLITEL